MYTVYVYIYVYTQVVLANSYQCFNDIHDIVCFHNQTHGFDTSYTKLGTGLQHMYVCTVEPS